MSANWEFHKRQRKMPLTTSIFNNVLQSSGFTAAERLVRESIQNSSDAHREGEPPVSVRIEQNWMTGTAKSQLVKALKLGREPRQRKDLFDLPVDNALDTIVDPEVPLSITSIADYHTKGLGGVWDGTGEADHFGRLVINLGVDDKADAAEMSGGSYGFGKTVYGKASKIGVVAFYSVFPETDETAGANARFMATGLFKAHEFKGEKFDGFAFFGGESDEFPGETIPLINDDAHSMAKSCGISVRSPHEYGTTILILDCELDPQELKHAIELYWWPRLIRSDLDVTLVFGDEEIIPRPKQNPQLKPFISCYQNFVSDTQNPPKSMLFKAERRISTGAGPLQPGVLSAAAVDEESKLANRVALMRGPGMVVSYHSCGNDGYEPCVGVFVAHADVEKILTFSEPQMHDRWDENSDRLLLKFGDDGKRVVASVLRRIEANFRDFKRKQEPPIPPGGLKARDLMKLLGRFVDVPGPVPVPPDPAEPRPVSISVVEDRVKRDGRILDQAIITLTLHADAPSECLECTLTATHEILGDSSLRLVGRSECSLESEAGDLLAKGLPPSITVSVCKDSPVKLIAYASVDEIAMTRMRVAVEKAQ